jgi:hypothetical protein
MWQRVAPTALLGITETPLGLRSPDPRYGLALSIL